MTIGTKVTALLAAGAIFCLCMALRAFAGPEIPALSCGPHDEIVGILKKEYDEVRGAFATISDGTVLAEVYVSPDQTWSFVITNAQGKTCLFAAGEDWEFIKIPKGNPL